MQPINYDDYSLSHSSKVSNLQKPSIFVKSTKNLLMGQSAQKSHRISLSVAPGYNTEQTKKLPSHKGSEHNDQSNNTMNTKLDINFSLNPDSIAGNTGCSPDFFVKNSKHREAIKPISNNSNLPKLMNSIFESGLNTKKSASNLLSYTPSEKGFRNHSLTKRNLETQGTKKDKSLHEMVQEIKGLEELRIGSITQLDTIETDGENSQTRIYGLKTQLIGLKRKVSALEKENQDLRGQLKVYRELAVKASFKDEDITSREKTLYTEIEGSKSSRSPGVSPKLKSSLVKSTADPALHERLTGLLKAFSKTQSLTWTLDSTLGEVCQALDCCFARVLITNEHSKKICEDFGNEKIKMEKLRLGEIEADMIEKKVESDIDSEVLNSMDSLNELKRSINTDKRMISYPIYSIKNPDELWGVIQVLGPMSTTKYERSKRKGGFNSKDEIILEIFAKIISLIINFYEVERMRKEQEKKIITYNGIMTNLVNSGTHQELVWAIKTKLPNYVGFENVGLLLYDPKAELLYTYDVQKKQNGAFHTPEPFKYPAKLGLSGKCINNEIEVYALTEPRKTREFQPEIDNITGAQTVKNIIIALIKDSKNRKLGIIQLVNKKNSSKLDENDKNAVKSIQKLLAGLITHVGQISAAVDFSSAVNNTMQRLEANFQSPNS